MRLDRPSSGSDKPSEGNHPPQPIPPPNSSYWSYGRRPPDASDFRSARDSSPDRPRDPRETKGESGEGTGWPKDKPKVSEIPKTPEEQIRELKERNKSLESENARLTVSYEKALGDLQRSRQETSHYKRELDNAKIDNSKLVDTNSKLVHRNLELHKKTESTSALDSNAGNAKAQADRIEKTAKRKNWFPTDKVTTAGTAVAGVAGTYAVMVGRVSSKEEAFGLACAGAGMAAMGLGREITDKVNDWRNKRAEKKNADR